MAASGPLLRRFAWLLALAGIVLCVVLVAVGLYLQDRRVEQELQQYARVVASAVERASARGSRPGDLAVLARDLRAVEVALVDDAGGAVVAASRADWTGQPASVLPEGMSGSAGNLRATRSAHVYAISLPVSLGAADGVPRPHTLGLLLNGSTLVAMNDRALQTFGLVAFFGVLLLGVAACRMLSYCVLKPLARIRAAREGAVRRSEQRLQLAVAGSNDALFDYDPVHRTLYLSDVFKRWVGGAEDGGQSVALGIDAMLERIHPDYVERVRAAIFTCGETGQSFDVEFQVNQPQAGGLWIQARGCGVPQQHGMFRVSGFASDISRRKMAESLLLDTVDRLGAVLDNIAEGIITLNEAGQVCAVNPAARQMFGIDRDDLVGRPLAGLLEIPSEGAGGWEPLADRQPREGRVVPEHADAFPAEFAVSTMRVRSDERFIVVLRDITERKVAEDRLRTAMEDSQAATRAKDEFLATMSHEIRTPMNGVLGMTQLLLDMELTQLQRETAQLIRSSGESLLTIINDILDFSRAGSGRLKVETVPFDLRQAIREVVELLGRRRSSVDLYVDYPPDLPGRLVGDPGRVRQVLMNLVGNALKFTEHGHVVVGVTERPTPRALDGVDGFMARLEITVEDTGPGIPDEAQDKLFEPFTQADASTTRRFGGTGLGLAISRRLVELMGGEISFDSESGRGTRFRFSLDLPTQSLEAARPAPAVLAGKRVLVVNDNARGLEILSSYLEHAGMETLGAASGPAALEILERERFDLALIDDQMPDMDGLLLCELIRIDQTWQDMRVVLLCAADIRGVDESGAVDRSIVRPVMPEHLIQELTVVLEPDQADAVGRVGRDDAAAAASNDPAAARARRAPGRQGSTRTSGGAQVRVLLAEDNVVNQKVAVRMLEKTGCFIDVADNGAEALEMWRHFNYDVIFMDCQMPELDGLEAARHIRCEELRRHLARTPIIAMTANAMHQDRSDCLAAGMDDYLSKPVNQGDLAEVLSRWVAVDSVQKAVGFGGEDSPPR